MRSLILARNVASFPSIRTVNTHIGHPLIRLRGANPLLCHRPSTGIYGTRLFGSSNAPPHIAKGFMKSLREIVEGTNKLVIALGSSAVTATGLYFTHRYQVKKEEYYRDQSVKDVFAKPKKVAHRKIKIHVERSVRKELAETIDHILRPSQEAGGCYVITGPKEVGKSTYVRDRINALMDEADANGEKRPQILYCNLKEGIRTLARTLNIFPTEAALDSVPPENLCGIAMDRLCQQLLNDPNDLTLRVLVLDDLAKLTPEEIRQIANTAKYLGDETSFKLVVVSSSGPSKTALLAPLHRVRQVVYFDEDFDDSALKRYIERRWPSLESHKVQERFERLKSVTNGRIGFVKQVLLKWDTIGRETNMTEEGMLRILYAGGLKGRLEEVLKVTSVEDRKKLFETLKASADNANGLTNIPYHGDDKLMFRLVEFNLLEIVETEDDLKVCWENRPLQKMFANEALSKTIADLWS